jgi:hypothetical protein
MCTQTCLRKLTIAGKKTAFSFVKLLYIFHWADDMLAIYVFILFFGINNSAMVLTMKLNCKKNNLLLIFANNLLSALWHIYFQWIISPAFVLFFYFCIRLIRMLSFSSLFYLKNIENKYVTRHQTNYNSFEIYNSFTKLSAAFVTGNGHLRKQVWVHIIQRL